MQTQILAHWHARAAGDLFFVIDRGPVVDYVNGGTAVGWLNTIDNILKFDFDVVIPGHGPVSERDGLVEFKRKLTMLQRSRLEPRPGVGLRADDRKRLLR